MKTQIQSTNRRITHLPTVTYYLPIVTDNCDSCQLWHSVTVGSQKMDNYRDRQLWRLPTVTNVMVGSQNVTVGASYNN